MNVKKAIKNRYSVRSYKDKEIPQEKLELVLEAGRLAPSGHNSQEWKFIVVTDEDTRQKLARAAKGQDFVAEAPVVIAAVGTDPDHIMSCGVPAYAVDVAIAVDHMTLQATEVGLGTCWIGAFDQKEVKNVISMPEDCKVVALLPLGYPESKPGKKSRKDFEQVISFEEF